jgi:FkbM family methyltransferase
VDSRVRSRFTRYRHQIGALGVWGFLRYKSLCVRSRFAVPGTELRVRTPLALHPLIVRAGTSDINSFKQIYLNREYRCLDNVPDAGLIVDCGANVGYSAAYFMSRYPNARVIAIEPSQENFCILQKNISPYHERCTAINAGVWSSSEGLILSDQELGDRQEWAVTVRAAGPGEEPSVQSVTLGSICATVPDFERISILKIDIEGSETEVFSNNTEAWIDKFDHLVIELHGNDCRQAVMSATSHLEYEVSECEELTVFSSQI